MELQNRNLVFIVTTGNWTDTIARIVLVFSHVFSEHLARLLYVLLSYFLNSTLYRFKVSKIYKRILCKGTNKVLGIGAERKRRHTSVLSSKNSLTLFAFSCCGFQTRERKWKHLSNIRSHSKWNKSWNLKLMMWKWSRRNNTILWLLFPIKAIPLHLVITRYAPFVVVNGFTLTMHKCRRSPVLQQGIKRHMS